MKLYPSDPRLLVGVLMILTGVIGLVLVLWAAGAAFGGH